MRIIVVNQPLNNRGDEAAHRSLMLMLENRFPNDEKLVLFVGANQNSIRQFEVFPEKNKYLNIKPCLKFFFSVHLVFRFNIVRLFRYIHPTHYEVFRIIKNADVVVCAPGGVCMGAYQNWVHIWLLNVALILKKKVAYYSRSIGPFPESNNSQKRFKRISLRILNQLDFVSLRDTFSQELASQLGIKITPSIDTAFLNMPACNIPIEVQKLIKNEYVVFVPNKLSWHPYFKEVYSASLDHFYISVLNTLLDSREGIQVVMLPQLFNTGEKNDINYFYHLKNIVKDDRVIIINDQFSSDIQQAIISKCSFLVGARYHSIIFAINNQIPFAALSYEHKMSGLLDMLELNDFQIDLQTIFKNNIYFNIEGEKAFKKLENCIVNPISKEVLGAKKLIAEEIALNCANEFAQKFGGI
ncbi:MAG: polysaccharide pyruvyl transferase family protein [Draconibacterium sp.]